jgi:fido (protein-threonine AMPylation protein)
VPESLNGEEIDGATPLDEDEAEGLMPDLHTRGELNAWELANILKAEGWAFGSRRRDILTMEYVRKLHWRMFGETWAWAGKFRRSDKSIGVYWATIPGELHNLLAEIPREPARSAPSTWLL